MKLNDLSHVCDSVCSKEVSLLRFMKFVPLVLFRCRKKKRSCIQKLDPDVSIVSSNSESEVPAKKKDLGWARGVFSRAVEYR